MKSKVPFSKDDHPLQRHLSVIAVVLVLTFLLASLALIFTSLHPGKNANAGSQFGVYVGSGDGAIFKLDAANGQQLWRYKTKGRSIPAPVTDSNGMIYFGGLDGFVYALSAADGKLNWSFQTQGSVLSSPTVANGVAYVGSSDGNLYALDAQKGTLIWHYHAGPATVAVDVHTVVVSNGVIYGSSSDNVEFSYLFALDAKSGKQLWSVQVKDQNFTAPQVNSGIIYIASWALEHQGGPDIKDSYVYAYNTNNGSLIWRSDKVGDFILAAPTIANGIIYIGSQDTFLYALDAKTGHRVWRHNVGGIIYTPLSLVNGVVYGGVLPSVKGDATSRTNDATQSDGSIVALNATNGSLIWQHTIANYTGTSLVVFNQVIYVGSAKDDLIHALRTTDASEIWSHQDNVPAGVYTNAPITAGP